MCSDKLLLCVQAVEVHRVLAPHLGDEHEIQCVTDAKVRSADALDDTETGHESNSYCFIVHEQNRVPAVDAGVQHSPLTDSEKEFTAGGETSDVPLKVKL